MKIRLTDGMELVPVAVTGGPRYVQGQSRDTLNFVFPASESMETLDAAFSAANCETITIQEDSGTENIHKAYTVRAALGKEPVEVTPATAEAPAVYEERITVSMAQRTYIETQLAMLQAAALGAQSQN
mgnify:CR=1 FL=1